MFKSWIGFYDNHAKGQMSERSAIITLFIKKYVNKSAKTPMLVSNNDKNGFKSDFYVLIDVLLSHKIHDMTDFLHHCFVCGKPTDAQNEQKNKQINLPVCNECIGTAEEDKAVEDLTEGMADGFVCGCI